MRKSLWPVAGVIAWLLAASLACSVSFSTAKIKSVKMTSDPEGKTKTTSYGPNDTFYCVVDLSNAPDDTKTRAVWTAVAVEGAAPNTQIGEYELKSGSGTLTFNVTPTEGSGWLPGTYRCTIYLNGEKKEEVDFEVKTPSPAS